MPEYNTMISYLQVHNKGHALSKFNKVSDYKVSKANKKSLIVQIDIEA